LKKKIQEERRLKKWTCNNCEDRIVIKSDKHFDKDNVLVWAEIVEHTQLKKKKNSQEDYVVVKNEIILFSFSRTYFIQGKSLKNNIKYYKSIKYWEIELKKNIIKKLSKEK